MSQDITFTDFINIVQSPGTTKLSKIRNIKKRVYSPATDYYKGLREKIIDVLSSSDDINCISDAVSRASVARQANYRIIADNMLAWLGKHRGLIWYDPPKAYYRPNKIGIKIHPELAFEEANGTINVIKLHMNKDALSKGKLEVAAFLFYNELAPKCPQNTVFSFLDLHQGKLFPIRQLHESGSIFLQAEIAYIEQIWDSA
ncbi:hypothetical protein SDC9_134911 [bioreactor metagenome]|uniref:Restriction endonuclease n=2 Tax=root TaxID=1 RepID=A0A212JQS2_9BACT|nr:hypothetical protein [Desulfovibrio desulfuricans]MCB6541293.1 hypothetical protein [Desulfovibrio desulfuricans]MCB6552375.1 hypothetical protein [Desulfovibrio desulfuricans]MCB6564378.1 hypothetical protein [Desulfovibrio desulfuricans]MCB7345398.1 hypothetical protein [Desulfovibrio desulfuricans]MCQ4860799.1 hypothetical protein [Desulfovibrio desulfuricans]